MKKSLIDETGKRYGRLTVLYRVPSTNQAKWLCKCDCGNTKCVYGDALRKGRTKSCGCLLSESTRERGKKYKVQNHRLYVIWYHMIRRCEDQNDSEYHNYGGRGISVSEQWHDFDTFAEWALNNGYEESLSIDRINNDGNYEEKNCRWATQKQQRNNSRQNTYITNNGTTKTVQEWAEHYNVRPGMLRKRIARGMNLIDAVTTPPKATNTGKMVMCIDTGEVFNSAKDASLKYGVCIGSVAHAASGQCKKSAGMAWKYLDA